jgi:hypothetical protein
LLRKKDIWASCWCPLREHGEELIAARSADTDAVIALL